MKRWGRLLGHLVLDQGLGVQLVTILQFLFQEKTQMLGKQATAAGIGLLQSQL